MKYGDVKIGDYVYFIGNTNNPDIKRDKPYKVVRTDSATYGLCISIAENYSAYFNYKDFITSSQYEKYKIQNDSKQPKIGDTVYYIGQSPTLKKDRPYKIINMRIKSMSGGEKIYNLTVKDEEKGSLYDGFTSDNFVPEKKYKNNNNNPNTFIEEESEEDYNFNPNIKEKKDDSVIRFQIFRDTKSGKLKWILPYKDRPEYYRTFLHLDSPPGSYLRFDISKIRNSWELWIHFHRNENADSIIIRKMQETRSLLKIINKIEETIEMVE